MSLRRSVVAHKTVPLCGGESKYESYRADPDGRVMSIMTGFGASTHHYTGFAEELARQGYTVVVPDISEPLAHEDPVRTMAYKCDRARRALEDVGSRMTIDSFASVGHSFGGVCQVGLLEDAPHELSEMSFINSLGFGQSQRIFDSLISRVMGFYVKEAKSIVLHPGSFIGVAALKKQIKIVSDLPNRAHELREINRLDDDFLMPWLELARNAGIPTKVFVSLLDHVVDPQPAIDRLGVHKVTMIHKKADHFAPNVYGGHVARLLVA